VQLRVGYRSDAPYAAPIRAVLLRPQPAAPQAPTAGADGGPPTPPRALSIPNGWDLVVDLGALPWADAVEVVYLDDADVWRPAMTLPLPADCAPPPPPAPTLWPPPGAY
jgi:hypothetical protein